MVHSKKDCDEIKKMAFEYPAVMTTTDTIKYILKNKCSVARFGDGEFNLCCGKDMSFEKAAGSEELTKKLIEILKTKSNDKILVCIPEFNSKFNNTKRVSGRLNFWEYYWFRMFKKLQGFLINDFYGNTNISRNDVFYENKLEFINQIWAGRDVVFVIGENGRFIIKEEFFRDINSYETILVPPMNAYKNYNEIFEQCLKHDRNKLFLIAAGPTATVLAFDLSKQGYQAIDIGHLPNSYDQYLGKIRAPESLPKIAIPRR